jgi:hypothetical protein
MANTQPALLDQSGLRATQGLGVIWGVVTLALFIAMLMPTYWDPL